MIGLRVEWISDSLYDIEHIKSTLRVNPSADIREAFDLICELEDRIKFLENEHKDLMQQYLQKDAENIKLRINLVQSIKLIEHLKKRT